MKKNNYSETIANSIKSFLEEGNWDFRFDEEKGVFRFGVSLRKRIKSVSYIIRVSPYDYVVYALSPIGVDSDDTEMMIKVSEFVNRINYGMPDGNFEIDMNDGEIRYKTYVDCSEGRVLKDKVIEESIWVPGVMFDRYSKGFVDIMFANAIPAVAAEECENDD